MTTATPGQPAPHPYGPEVEAEYRKRFQSRYVEGDRSYRPLLAVPGAEHFQALPGSSDEVSQISPAALAAAENYAEARNSSAFLVWHKGYVERETYFGGMKRQSLLASGSLAKPMAVIAVGRAIQTGHIDSLDQPASQFFHEWVGTPKAGITIRHLLDMRSGLMAQSLTLQPVEDVMNRAFLHPYHARVILEEYPLTDAPGQRYAYSNAALDLVAPLIERATGQPYGRWLSEEVLMKIGARGGVLWENRAGGVPHSGCCAKFPADTYLRLALLVALKGQWRGEAVLGEEFVKEMVTPTPQNPHAGMGLYIGSPYVEWRGPLNPEKSLGRVYHSEPYLADDLVLFDGNSNQVIYIIPSEELVIVRLGGRPTTELGWDNAHIPNLVLNGVKRGETQLIP